MPSTIDMPNSPLNSRPSSYPQTVEQQNETRLIERCKRGDCEAWTQLIRRYERPIYHYAYKLCRNREQAHDIVGQTFLHLYRSLSTFQNNGRFSTWLFRIVYNNYIDQYRASRYIQSFDEETTYDGERLRAHDPIDPGLSPIETCLLHEEFQILGQAICQLPAVQRQAIWMYHLKGKSYEEIAEREGVCVGTIKSRLHRGRAALRRRLNWFT